MNNFTPVVALWLLLGPCFISAQKQKYTHADTLKGTITRERAWWDVKYYDLHVVFNPVDSSIRGLNSISYSAIESYSVMQLDLIAPMTIDSVKHYSEKYKLRRDGNAYYIEIPKVPALNTVNEIHVYFHGKPIVAKMPPWDGGVVWSHDAKNNPWMSIACQGMAAGVWFPNKDHMYDEVDGCTIHITAPKDLVAVSNGRLLSSTSNPDGTRSSNWEVKNPINNYCIIPYIGKYKNFKDTIRAENGILDLDFWVLEDNVDKAKAQFTQVKPMIHCFEHWFGPYPFYSDGYKLVEAPYLGMEHQSAIAYGNNFVNGYKGRDLSLTGWGLKWDFIIVHESGHEWFGNNISAKDVADNWIHEGFTAYSENLYTEYLYGKQAGAEYVIGTRKAVMNDKPIISDYNVNAGGSIDLYYKGANMLHTIRQLVNNDLLWRDMLRGLNKTFYHKTVTTKDIEDYMSSFLKLDLQKVFDQYLRTTQIPVLEYRLKRNKLSYRWANTVPGFNMPVKINSTDGAKTILPTEKWQKTTYKDSSLVVDINYYIIPKKL